ncbi:hypothetical protein C8Q72DRAFT_60956 [Fomitopsis betulina]|nr:hypothetical protein C8Q72DRAFT_60956 [Fomitopsis betulina]
MAGIDIKNTPTTYTSDAIILPTEILLLIRSFLRDQPVPRSRCRLVCHLWFHFFRVENMTRIASTEDMNVMARIMTSQENRRFGRFVSSMTGTISPGFAVWNSWISIGRQHAHIPSSSIVFRISLQWKNCVSSGATCTAQMISGTYYLPYLAF